MSTATRTSNPAWQAEVKWERRYLPMTKETTAAEMEETTDGETVRRPPTTRWREAEEGETVDMWLKVSDCFVDVFRPGGERIRFGVNHRNGRRLTLTDPRARTAGTAGTTGIWGTRPALRADRPRALTPDRLQVGSGAADRSGAGRGDRPAAAGMKICFESLASLPGSAEYSSRAEMGAHAHINPTRQRGDRWGIPQRVGLAPSLARRVSVLISARPTPVMMLKTLFSAFPTTFVKHRALRPRVKHWDETTFPVCVARSPTTRRTAP